MHHTPTRQLPACELTKRGIALPYFHPTERDHLPVQYHLTVTILDDWELDLLTVAARKHAAVILPNEHDNRGDNLNYPARPKEILAFVRHMLINRTANNVDQGPGYQGGYDNIIWKIAKKGVDVAARQLAFKRHVGALIAANYPQLATEVEYWLWQTETKHQSEDRNEF